MMFARRVTLSAIVVLLIPWAVSSGSRDREDLWADVVDNTSCGAHNETNKELLTSALGVASQSGGSAVLSSLLRPMVLSLLKVDSEETCGVVKLAAQLVLLLSDFRSAAVGSAPDVKPGAESEKWIERMVTARVQLPLPAFLRVASHEGLALLLAEVQAAGLNMIGHFKMNVTYGSCYDVPDPHRSSLATNEVERAAGVTFWRKAHSLAHTVASRGIFEWTNQARVAFSQALEFQEHIRKACPQGVLSMRILRCIGHDAEQKLLEFSGLPGQANLLLDWASNPDVPALLMSDWPLWQLVAMMSRLRTHGFVITPRDASSKELFRDAPSLRGLWPRQFQINNVERFQNTIVWLVHCLPKLGWKDLIVWIGRLDRALQPESMSREMDQVILIVDSRSVLKRGNCDSLRRRVSWMHLDCVFTLPEASPGLDIQAIAWALLEAQKAVVLLSMNALVFPGLGDRVTVLLIGAITTGVALLATDSMKVWNSSDEETQMTWAPYVDIGMRILVPCMPTAALLRFAVGMGYENPFHDAETLLNRFNLTQPPDKPLGPANGFISSEGWFGNPAREAGVFMFTAKPFNVMPGWFREPACAVVCQLGLLSCSEDVKDSCDLLVQEDDTVLLKILQRTFELKDPAARSARPRLVQVGPSGCATTAIATFFTDLHNLRVAKSYVEGEEIRDVILAALKSGLAPFHRFDRFDVITDAFDVVRGGIPFCVDHLGPGGNSCQKIDGEALHTSVQTFTSILRAMRAAYPNLRFILNTRRIDTWLPNRVHNCWPHLVNSQIHWDKYLEVWEQCCDPAFGEGGNVSCWHGEAGDAVALPAQMPVKAFGYLACCRSLSWYQQAWEQVHAAVITIGGPDRVVAFHIEQSDPLVLSDALGLREGHDAAGWRKVHVSPKPPPVPPMQTKSWRAADGRVNNLLPSQ